MANRFWVGGSDSWNDVAGSKWALTSGGAGGEAIPTSSDDVFFDGNSGAVTVSVAAGNTGCLSIDFTGFTGTFAATSYADLQVYGSFTGDSGMTMTNNGSMTFKSTSTGKTLTINGLSLATLTWIFDGVGGEWTLQDALTIKSISLTNGSFVSGNNNITCVSFGGSNSNTRSLTFGSNTIELTGTSGAIWNFTTSTGLTLTPGTSTIKITSASGTVTFAGGNKTYNNLWHAAPNATALIITGSNTFNDLKLDPSTEIRFTATTTTIVTSFTAVGTEADGIIITSATAASHTLSDTGGTNTVSYCTISYSTAGGGATWDASDGTNTNGGNNSGWTWPSTGLGGIMTTKRGYWGA